MITATEICTRLREVFEPNEYAMYFEVPTMNNMRRCDALAVNLWASKGHAVHGFEIKVSRSDWLRELKQPEKCQKIIHYCHHWWIVAPPGVVEASELPPNWGLMVVTDKRVNRPVKRKAMKAAPLDVNILIPILRREQGHSERIVSDTIRRQVEERVKAIREDYAQRVIDLESRSVRDNEFHAMVSSLIEDTRMRNMRPDDIKKVFSLAQSIVYARSSTRNLSERVTYVCQEWEKIDQRLTELCEALFASDVAIQGETTLGMEGGS